MGREIVIKGIAIKGKDKIELYGGYTCGRDSATEYIQGLYNNTWKAHGGYTEEQIDSFNDFERADYFSIHYELKQDHDMTLVKDIMDRLREYSDEDEKEIKKAYEELESLKEAKKNCKSFDDYQKFNNAIDDVQAWLDNEDYSRAGSILKGIQDVLYEVALLKNSHKAIYDYFDSFELWLEASE